MPNKVLEVLRQRRAELDAIAATWATWATVTEWHARTQPFISLHFKSQLKAFDETIKFRWASFPRIVHLGSGSRDDGGLGAKERAANDRIATNAKNKLLAQIDALIELTEMEAGEVEEVAGAAELGDAVFLVHGRDERWLSEVARFIEKLGVNVRILREQANQGRTIIEKFEDVSEEVGFAVVLLTGDDKGGLADATPKNLQPRARQNVILELGFFLGRLGRARVCALFEDGVEIPSDYKGVLFVPIDDAGGWQMPLAREMKVAGLPIDLNKVV